MDFSSQIALRLYNLCNHCLSTKPTRVAESGPRAQLQVLQISQTMEISPFLGQVVDLDLLLCSVCTGFNLEYADMFLCLVFTQILVSKTDKCSDQKIE